MTHIKTFVILIIAVIAVIGGIYFFRDRFDSEKFETVKTNMLLIEAKTKIIGEKVKIKEKDAKYVGKEIEELKEDEKIKSLIDNEIIKLDQKDVKYYVLEKADIESMGLNNINMDDGYYIVEYMSNEIIYSAGIENEEGDTVYKLSDIKEKTEENVNNTKDDTNKVNEEKK